MNKKGMKPDSLLEAEVKQESKKPIDLLEQESLTRFDRNRNNKDGNNGNRNKKKRKGIMTTARRHRPKVEIVRSNLRGGRTRIDPNRQRTATEEKEETEKIVRETITIITGTEDRIKDGIMRTDVRKEDRIRNVHRIRTVRRIKSVHKIKSVR